MKFRDFLSLWNHPVTRLLLFMNPLVILPICWSFIAPNFVQTDIENFITSSHVVRYNVTMAPATVKQLYGILMAIPFVSALFSAPLVKTLADRFGRRLVLLGITGVLNVLCHLCYLLAPIIGYYELLYVGRVIWGPIWISTMAMFPIYISELAPPETRGALATIGSMFGTVFLFLTKVFGLPQLLGHHNTWHIYLFIPAIFGFFSALLMTWFPETPKFLFLNKGNKDKASEVLRKYYRGYSEKQIEDSVEQFQRESQQAKSGISLLEIVRNRTLRRILFIAVAVAITRVSCGGFIVGLYSTSTAVELLGMDPTDAKYINMAVGFFCILSNLLAVWVIERCGRRPLYFVGMTGMVLSSVVFFIIATVNYYHVVVVPQPVFYIAFLFLNLNSVFFNGGPETITVHYVAELTPQHARASITTVSSTVGVFFRLLYFYLFPPLQTTIGPWSIFSLLIFPTSLILIFLHFHMLETKGKHVSQIVDELETKMKGNGKESNGTTEVKGREVTDKTTVC